MVYRISGIKIVFHIAHIVYSYESTSPNFSIVYQKLTENFGSDSDQCDIIEFDVCLMFHCADRHFQCTFVEHALTRRYEHIAQSSNNNLDIDKAIDISAHA